MGPENNTCAIRAWPHVCMPVCFFDIQKLYHIFSVVNWELPWTRVYSCMPPLFSQLQTVDLLFLVICLTHEYLYLG